MRNKMLNKVLAGMLVGSMVLGMSVVAYADPAGSGGGTGDGFLEGHVDKSKLSVTLPTNDDTTTFKYTIDPEGLIAATQAAKYPGTTYNSATGVYFQTSEKNYTDKSGKLKVTNMGSVDADVTVEVSVAENSGITDMKAKTDFTEAGAEELYLGLLVNSEAGIAVTAAGDSGKATKTVGLKGRPANFEVKYNSDNNKYEYVAKDGVADTAWNSFEFGLEGACNTKGNYSAENFAVPTVTVTWSYIEHPETGGAAMLDENAVTDAAPSVETKTYTMTNGQDVLVDISLGGGNLGATGVTSVSYASAGKTYSFASGEFKIENGKLVLSHSKTDVFVSGGVKNREITIQFNDTAKTKGKVILTTAD